MHKVDKSFKASRLEYEKRGRSKLIRRWLRAMGAVVLIAVFVGLFLTYDEWSIEGLDNELVPVAAQGEIVNSEDVAAAVVVPTVVDLPGDPLIIQLERSGAGGSKAKTLERKPDVPPSTGIPERVIFLSETMVDSSQRFMTTLPSTPEDFQYFQSQRSLSSSDFAENEMVVEHKSLAEPVNVSSQIDTEEHAGWGGVGGVSEGGVLEFTETRIQNTTSIAFMKSEDERFKTSRDIFIKVLSDRKLSDLLIEQGIAPTEAKRAEELAAEQLSLASLERGHLVALRGLIEPDNNSAMAVAQISIYQAESYLGTIVRVDAETLSMGSDPWVKDDLYTISKSQGEYDENRKYRFLDAIYSAGTRNSVPQGIVGEAIMLLSRSQDLNQFADVGDRLVLIYSSKGRSTTGGTSGKLLYAGVRAKSGNFDCFVYRLKDAKDFACVSESSSEKEVKTISGMVVPVAGVMTSKFGPRHHPILKKVKLHAGVDWAAPTGTPIYAAMDGTVSYAGDAGGYGNVIYIKHGNSRETRYAHMSRYASNIKAGLKVRAGSIIGYVGTTGRSTGPHLHFELRQSGQPVDPIGYPSVAAVAPARGRVLSDAGAVAKLTNKIIGVESGGNPRAKNPLSSATGLGQFISSTWIRMMNTYRPDLARSMSRKQLLALRFNPQISREMVSNLAREGEAYLRRRGHGITAGRLYLAHFLGMDGAHTVLSSPDGASLLSVLGSAVIRANPFLTGKNVAYVKNWAERKMNRKVKRYVQPATTGPVFAKKVIKRLSKDFLDYRASISAMLKQNGVSI